MTSAQKGFWLSFAGCAGAACFLISFKLAAGLGDTSDATLVMLVSAATLNTLTSVAHERGRSGPSLDRLSWLLSIGLSVMTLAGNELAIESVKRISAPLTSVLQQTQVLFVVLLGRLILQERVTLRFWLGLSVAAAGLVLIHGAPSATLTTDRAGMLLAAGSAVCWAVMAVYTRKFIHRIRPIPVNTLRLWFSIALWFAIHGRAPRLPMRLDFIVFCSVAGAFGPYLSRTAQMHALAYIPPTKSILIGLLTPALTIIPAFFVFGSIPTGRELAGSLLMIAGIALPVLERASDSQPRPV